MSEPQVDLQDVAQMHDLLLRFKPSEAAHDASLCPFCETAHDGVVASTDDTPLGGGDMSNKTYTDEDVAAMLAPLREELAELKASQDQAAVEARFAAQETAHAEAIAELQLQLDQAKAEAAASQQLHDDLVAYLEEEGAKAEAEAALAARREEVKAAVADIFDADHIEANLDRWASLEADTFDALVADWTAIRGAKADSKAEAETPISSTAMETAAQNTNEGKTSYLNLLRNPAAVRAVGAPRT